MHLFSKRSQKTPKCGKNISDNSSHSPDNLCHFLVLPHAVICDLLLNICSVTQKLFVKHAGTGKKKRYHIWQPTLHILVVNGKLLSHFHALLLTRFLGKPLFFQNRFAMRTCTSGLMASFTHCFDITFIPLSSSFVSLIRSSAFSSCFTCKYK